MRLAHLIVLLIGAALLAPSASIAGGTSCRIGRCGLVGGLSVTSGVELVLSLHGAVPGLPNNGILLDGSLDPDGLTLVMRMSIMGASPGFPTEAETMRLYYSESPGQGIPLDIASVGIVPGTGDAEVATVSLLGSRVAEVEFVDAFGLGMSSTTFFLNFNGPRSGEGDGLFVGDGFWRDPLDTVGSGFVALVAEPSGALRGVGLGLAAAAVRRRHGSDGSARG